MNKIKVLITGSNGLVGQALQATFKDSSRYEIVATSLHDNRFPDSNHTFDNLDITNPIQVNYIINLYQPDVVINSAAISQVDYCEEHKEEAWHINVEGVKHLLEACQGIKAHFIQLSSDFVFDGMKGMYQENDEPRPISFYGQTKREAEKIIITHYERYSIVRTVLVYGLNYNLGRSNILTWVLDSLKEGKSINVVHDQYRTPTMDMDLAKGIQSILEKKIPGVFHLSGPEYVSVFDFARAIAQVFSLDASLIQPISSLTLNQIGKRPPKTGFDISKANKELNFLPHSVIEGLAILKKEYLP